MKDNAPLDGLDLMKKKMMMMIYRTYVPYFE